ncbi:MAG: hypothetical protein BGN86_08050 [Caulobacterales bacterium 68-7]|nr:hypothetical protein [Caulobacterales bacterium]OJU07756.1 MAG: hypothetical protein BGN86_08050 [Caulobacterales bacterium 68-7]
MAETKTPAEIAERIQKRRVALMMLFPILYLSQQAPFWLKMLSSQPFRFVDKVQIGAYTLWALALLVLLATGGGLGRSQAVRDLLSDESTREHRAKAYASGFWALILGCAALGVASLFTALSPLIILNALLTLGVVVPCLTFVVLERRALRD